MSEIDRNIAIVLAATLVFESTQEWLPVRDARMDDDAAPDVGKSTRESVAATVENLPAYLRALGDWMPYLENSKLGVAKSTSPQYAKLQAGLFEKYGPKLADTAQKIDASNKLSGAQSDLDVLKGPGQGIVDASTEMLRKTDPEFFKVREAASGNVLDLLKGGLTPAEEEAINRRILQDDVGKGLLGVPSATRTVSNAMQFGNAARNRQMQGVAAASSFLPVSRTNFDPTQIALGRPSINTGDSKFMGVQQPSSDTVNSGNNFFNQVSGFKNTQMGIDAQRRDWMDRVNEGVGSINF
jgi:hypothetical protein